MVIEHRQAQAGEAWLQGHKVYVQDRIRQAKDRVWELLSQGAHLYICGDAANMAGETDTAVLVLPAWRLSWISLH